MNISMITSDIRFDSWREGYCVAYLEPGFVNRLWDEHGLEVKGSPMGRGATAADAIDDLIYRVSIESHFELKYVGDKA